MARYYSSYGEALRSALDEIGRPVDPDALRERAQAEKLAIPGIASGRAGHDITGLSLSGMTGRTVYWLDRDHLGELAQLVDGLTGKSKRSAHATAAA